jgi:hypothetical protein
LQNLEPREEGRARQTGKNEVSEPR